MSIKNRESMLVHPVNVHVSLVEPELAQKTGGKSLLLMNNGVTEGNQKVVVL